MNRSITAVLLVVGLGLSGCVQSWQPFYTEQSKAPVPELVGEWDAKKALDDVPAGAMRPWVCREETNATYIVATVDTNNVAAELVLVTFRVGNQLYGDVTAGDLNSSNANRYWNTSLAPIHTVWQLHRSNDVVALRALSPDWLEKAVDAKTVTLPYIQLVGEKRRLFTASPEQWQAFLAQHGTNIAVFGGDPTYLFQKRAAHD